MREGFRGCYLGALAVNPRVAGKVVVTMKVACDGSIHEVKVGVPPPPAGAMQLPADTANCMTRVIRDRRFAEPEGGFATIQVPVDFVRSGPQN